MLATRDHFSGQAAYRRMNALLINTMKNVRRFYTT